MSHFIIGDQVDFHFQGKVETVTIIGFGYSHVQYKVSTRRGIEIVHESLLTEVGQKPIFAKSERKPKPPKLIKPKAPTVQRRPRAKRPNSNVPLAVKPEIELDRLPANTSRWVYQPDIVSREGEALYRCRSCWRLSTDFQGACQLLVCKEWQWGFGNCGCPECGGEVLISTHSPRLGKRVVSTCPLCKEMNEAYVEQEKIRKLALEYERIDA